MSGYRKSSHTVYQIHYHFVFITKYRKPMLRGEIGQSVREITREICRSQDIEVIKGHVPPDHVHLLLSVPPQLSPSRVMQAIKGKSSHKLLREYRSLKRAFWGRHTWARGYFVATTGNITDEVIASTLSFKMWRPQMMISKSPNKIACIEWRGLQATLVADQSLRL